MNDDLEKTLATIAKMAPELAKQRVQSVTVEGVSFVLLPAESEPTQPVAADDKNKPKTEEPTDPLNDPKTYGWFDSVPGFRDPRKAKQ
jgi:hypothetical protein